MSVVRMSIGADTKSSTSPSIGGAIFFQERYFGDFASYLVAGVGFAHAVESVHGKASKYSSTDTIQFGCKQSGAVWQWHPAPVLESFASNFIPDRLHLVRIDSILPPREAQLNLGALTMLFQTFAQAMATNYFERYKKEIRAKYGAIQNWPPVWNFARVVRNAMAHGGRISIEKSSEPSVSWKGLTYGFDDNGRDILCQDLWPGDLFDLVREQDKHL